VSTPARETILQTLQLKTGEPYRAPRAIAAPPAGRDAFDRMVRVDAGTYPIGTDDRTAAYDNERPRHPVTVNAFDIDAAPVTNAAYEQFIADGGYQQPELWSDDGRAWLADSSALAPKYWTASPDGWLTRTMDVVAPIGPDHPVCHVCYHEADAYARWAGKRLPTEQEWEIAASWDPTTASSQRFPWGDADPTALHANVDQRPASGSPPNRNGRSLHRGIRRPRAVSDSPGATQTRQRCTRTSISSSLAPHRLVRSSATYLRSDATE